MTMRLGVYALGAADAAERHLIEDHLPECADCRAELANLAPLPQLLRQVPELWVAEQSTYIVGRARPPAAREGSSVARGGRRAHSWRVVASTAAAALATGLASGLWLLPHTNDASTADAVGTANETFSALNPVTHVYASAALTGTSWGTSIQVTAEGLPRGQVCWLIVHSRTGGTEVDAYWQARVDGRISVPGSAAWQPSDIAEVQVVTNTDVLVTIVTSSAGPSVGIAGQVAGGTP